MPNATKHIDGPNILTFWDVFIFKHDVSQKSLKILGPWGGVFTKMKTKNEPSILELTVSIFLCSDLPDFVPWGGVFLQKIFCFFVKSENFLDKNGTILKNRFRKNKKIYKNFVLNFDV